MTSKAPAQCCTIGVKHEGQPTGKSTKLGSTEIYIAEPTGETIHANKAILFLPDVISIWQNSQLMADQFAANGYYVLMVDQFNGDPMKINRPKDFDFPGWVTGGTTGDNPHGITEVEPVVEAGIKFLKDAGYTKIGAVGYCFGAKYVVRQLAEGKGIDVGYLAHPSLVTAEELAAVKKPISIAAAEIDVIFTTEDRHSSEKILADTKQPYQITLYGGVAHGFSIRGDVTVPHIKFAKEAAFLQAVSWFDTWLV